VRGSALVTTQKHIEVYECAARHNSPAGFASSYLKELRVFASSVRYRFLCSVKHRQLALYRRSEHLPGITCL